jgi:hypothetical protein
METSAPVSCANCSAPFAGVYCSTCGEKRLSAHDFSVRHFVEHAVHDFTHFDARIFRSLLPLVLKPGLLTAEFIAGRRTRYIKPLTLFILVNLFFFLTKEGMLNFRFDAYASSVGGVARRLVETKVAARGLTMADYAEHFTAVARERQRTMFFFLIPALALLFVPFARRRYYVEHLVYSIHFHAFLLILMVVGLRVLLIPLGLVAAAGAPGPFRFFSRQGFVIPVLLGMVGYHAIALRRVYVVGWAAALASSVALTLAEILLLLFVYLPLMFFVVYYST